MAADDELIGFVKQALSGGQSRASVRDVLLKAGWNADSVQAALAVFADVEFPVPVPRPRPYLSAREAFTYLLMFVMLNVTAWNLVSLIFDLINVALPDPAMATRYQHNQYTRIAIRWSASAVMVAFPVFVYLSVLAVRAVRLDPTKRASKVRRWVTYLTLFITATALICDVITLVYNLLGGELTTRLMLKVLTVGVIAGAAFGYYLSDLRVDEKDDRSTKTQLKDSLCLGFASVLVVGAVTAAIVMMGGPGEGRARGLDEARVGHLSAISSQINVVFAREKRLPATLDELSMRAGFQLASRDPLTGAPYEYRATGPTAYELCATFQRASDDVLPGSMGPWSWPHPAGRHCFPLAPREPGH